MADFNTLFKVLNTINALTTPNELTDKMGSKINEMIQSLSPSEKKQAKDALKEKKKDNKVRLSDGDVKLQKQKLKLKNQGKVRLSDGDVKLQKQGMRHGGKASKKCSMNRDNRNTRKVNN